MPVVIDTDGGVDDAVALWWALTDPAFDVVAITTVAGNVRVGQAAALVRRVLQQCRRDDVAEAQGEDLPARRSDRHDAPLSLFGAPAGSVGAAELLAGLPDGTDLITLGPLSNVAAAIALDPMLPTRLGRVVLMGGPLEASEFNFDHDEEATRIVLDAPWSSPPLVVGLDRTVKATLTDDEFALLAQHRTPAAAFLDAPLRAYRNVHGGGDCPVHDFLAVLAYVDPDVDALALRVAVTQLFS